MVHVADKGAGWKDGRKRALILEKWAPELVDQDANDLHEWSIRLVGYMRAKVGHNGTPKRPLSDAAIRNVLASTSLQTPRDPRGDPDRLLLGNAPRRDTASQANAQRILAGRHKKRTRAHHTDPPAYCDARAPRSIHIDGKAVRGSVEEGARRGRIPGDEIPRSPGWRCVRDDKCGHRSVHGRRRAWAQDSRVDEALFTLGH